MRKVSLVVVALLGAFTVADIAYQSGRATQDKPELISDLLAPAPLPRLRAEATVTGGDEFSPMNAGCRILVVFEPTCPYCHMAAKRLHARDRRGDTIPVLWITNERDGIDGFRDLLGDRGQVFYSRSIISDLSVNGVPAAFLVAPDNVVKKVWVFQGTEDMQELIRLCSGRSQS